jgi:ribonuclease inhibitor
MKTIRLDGTRMTSVGEAHRYLMRRLHLPGYYGGNLDALWDVLSTQDKALRIRLTDPDALRMQLGDYGDAMIRVFLEAGAVNPNLQVEIAAQDPKRPETLD